MKNLKVNKEKIASLLLAGSIMLSLGGCSKDARQNGDTEDDNKVTISTLESVTYEKNSYFYNHLLAGYSYSSINDNSQFIIQKGTNVYFNLGDIKTEVINEDEVMVTVISSKDDYALITLPDGRSGYVDIAALCTTDKISDGEYDTISENVNVATSKRTFLYNFQGRVIKCLFEDLECKRIATIGDYTYIELRDGTDGFVLSDSLMETYEYINGYAVVNKGTKIYMDSDFTQVAYTTDDVQMLYVEYINQDYAGVFDCDGRELMYVKANDLRGNFIYEDLTNQRMHCYLNYEIAAVFPTRSGKLESPTDEGVFTILDKQEDFAFTDYPGSRAQHWILYNYAAEEGIHDLVGDDEEYYGNQAYQLDGSHGCIRVPANASEFIYNHYEIGDMVIVAHDDYMLIYNTAKNEIGIYYIDEDNQIEDTNDFTKKRSK